MDEQGVETFLCIVENRSLTQAAEALFISQSSASKRLKKLEEELGFALLHRGRGLKGVYLTAKGERFLEIARNWKRLRQEVLALRDIPDQGDICLAIPELFSFSWMRQLTEALLAAHSWLRPSFMTAQSAEMGAIVEARRADMAVSLEKHSSLDVSFQRCHEDPWCVIHAGDGTPRPPSRIRVEDLDPRQEVRLNYNNPDYQTWRRRHIPYAKSIYVNNLHTALSLLCSPSQWCVIPLSAGIQARRQGFRLDALADPPPALAYYLLTHCQPLEDRRRAIETLTAILSPSFFMTASLAC